jgi:chitinase
MKNTHPTHAASHPSRSNTKRTWWGLAAALASLSLASATAVAALPARVFAPYIQVDGSTSLTSVSSASGIKYFTLAFIIDDGSHHGLWEAGSTVASDSSIAPAIANLRSAGGDVIISFGGAAGNELAIGITSVSTLQSVYQGIINKYGVTALDFDIEGSALDNTSANDRRNQALAGLQAANPGMIISYTLPVDPTGLPSNAIALLNNAKSHGVVVNCVNIMAMDYGSSTSPSMGQKAIDATNATSSQLSSNGINAKIGITPLIGKQDTAPEVFTTGDATTVENFAVGNSQVNRIAFWEVALDQCGSSCSGTSQSVWQFSHIFEPFTGGTTSTVAAPSFVPGAGTYTSAQNVSITTTTSGASIRYTTNGTTPSSTSGTLYSGPVSISTTTTLKAIAYKSGSNDSSVTSGTYTINTGGGGSSLTGTSSDGFHSLAMSAAQSGTFTTTFDATPSISPENAVVALSQGAATAYTSMSCIARFNATGQIDAYNGTAYGAATTINYSAGVSYHFRMVVNVPAHTYSVFVTPAGGSEITVGSNFAFRSTANTVTSLDNWDLDVNATPAGASLTANNLAVSSGTVRSLTGTSSDGFHSLSISPAKTGTFTATFDATPSISPENAVVALSQGAATAYTSMSCIARFNATGQIDAYNGTAYGAASSINYSAGVSYHFRLVINVTAHTYSVFVTPAGGSELTVGSNFAFRSTANTVTSLDNWDLDVNATPAGASLTATNLSP